MKRAVLILAVLIGGLCVPDDASATWRRGRGYYRPYVAPRASYYVPNYYRPNYYRPYYGRNYGGYYGGYRSYYRPNYYYPRSGFYVYPGGAGWYW